MQPTIVSGLAHDSELVMRESFCPVLYVMPFDNLDQVIKNFRSENDSKFQRLSNGTTKSKRA